MRTDVIIKEITHDWFIFKKFSGTSEEEKLVALIERVINDTQNNHSEVYFQAFVFFRFVDIIVITVHDRFWNVGQANCILEYFEHMMIDHSDSTIF